MIFFAIVLAWVLTTLHAPVWLWVMLIIGVIASLEIRTSVEKNRRNKDADSD